VETGLVVDDDLTVRDVVRRYLEHAGHRVLMAGDGEEALRLIGDSHPDLVVLDIMLPGVDGIEMADGPGDTRRYRSSCSPRSARRRTASSACGWAPTTT
jgi:DNA-binding response OmpR family regulator